MKAFENRTWGQLLDERASRFGEKCCLVIDGRRITYGELKEESDKLSLGLHKLGIRKNDKVAIWMTNSLEWVISMFAVTKIGAILVPVNTRFKIYELEYILQQSDSSALIMIDRFRNIDYVSMVLELVPELRDNLPGRLESGRLPELRTVICHSDRHYNNLLNLASLIEMGSQGDEAELRRISESVTPTDVALIQYTSGTTSFPKGAMLTHDGARAPFNGGLAFGVKEKSILFSPLPFFHVGGPHSIFMSIIHGATLVSLETFDAEKAFKAIEQEGCTIFFGVESMFIAMLNHPGIKEYDLTSLESAVTTGTPATLKGVEENMKVLSFSLYGLSESWPNATHPCAEDAFEKRAGTVGKPEAGMQVKIVDPTIGGAAPSNVDGEICLKGFSIMKGYYKKAEETKEAIDSDGWFHTGDLGSMDDEGYLIFKGRIKDMLRVGGENVSAQEVEDFLLTHPKVKQVAVIGVPDVVKVEVPMAVIQLKEGVDCSQEEIIDYCKGKIANFKVPRYVQFETDFEMTGSGKIQKFKLREKLCKQLVSNGIKSI